VIAKVFVAAGASTLTLAEIQAAAAALRRGYQALGAQVYVPRDDEDYSVSVGLRMLELRRLIARSEAGWRMEPQHEPLLRYYANAIAQLDNAPADCQTN
jgi:glycerol-3-phosphate O-acyltransferase